MENLSKLKANCKLGLDAPTSTAAADAPPPPQFLECDSSKSPLAQLPSGARAGGGTSGENLPPPSSELLCLERVDSKRVWRRFGLEEKGEARSPSSVELRGGAIQGMSCSLQERKRTRGCGCLGTALGESTQGDQSWDQVIGCPSSQTLPVACDDGSTAGTVSEPLGSTLFLAGEPFKSKRRARIKDSYVFVLNATQSSGMAPSTSTTRNVA
mmetsp:Transcript_20104/g.50626  ORF Transcript_20104/g.50626 Transcript_20104/m.50626 type:complete len:212 (-) Transcript_20104:515-1150(-)